MIDPSGTPIASLRAAAAAGVRIAYVAEIHVHNDYVSGGWALASELAVPISSPRPKRCASPGTRSLTATRSSSTHTSRSGWWLPRGTLHHVAYTPWTVVVPRWPPLAAPSFMARSAEPTCSGRRRSARSPPVPLG